MDIFLPIFKALQDNGVRYVTVGGLATVLHGYARLTADIDLIVDLDEKNCAQAIRALTQIGFKPRAPVDANDFAIEANERSGSRRKALRCFLCMEIPDYPWRLTFSFVSR